MTLASLEPAACGGDALRLDQRLNSLHTRTAKDMPTAVDWGAYKHYLAVAVHALRQVLDLHPEQDHEPCPTTPCPTRRLIEQTIEHGWRAW